MIRLATAHLEVELDEGRGAEIVRLGRPGGPNRLARIDSDWPLRAGAGGSYHSADLEWLSEHRGGWQEMFPNAGAGCTVNGIPHPVHGEASMAPWEVLERSGGFGVTLRSHTHTPLAVTRKMFLDPDRPRLELAEEIHNLSDDLEVPYAWGHHPAFAAPARDPPGAGGRPLRGRSGPGRSRGRPEARFSGETGRGQRTGAAAPVDLGVMPDHPAERVVYLTGPAEARAQVLRPDTGDRLTMEWCAEAFPYAWLWINNGAARFPWFGRLRAMALEPVNVWPADGLAAAVERGRAPVLAGGESRRGWLTVSLSEDG